MMQTSFNRSQHDEGGGGSMQKTSGHIAEGLSTTQATALLELLKEKKIIHGLGTPSREEVVDSTCGPSGALRAVGTVFQDNDALDKMLVQLSVQMAAGSRGSSSALLDVSIIRIKMAPGSGVDELAIAQVYPSDPHNSTGIAHDQFEKLTAQYRASGA